MPHFVNVGTEKQPRILNVDLIEAILPGSEQDGDEGDLDFFYASSVDNGHEDIHPSYTATMTIQEFFRRCSDPKYSYHT